MTSVGALVRASTMTLKVIIPDMTTPDGTALDVPLPTMTALDGTAPAVTALDVTARDGRP